MNLYRIGKTVLNIDRVNGILDHHVPADPGAPDGRTVLRVLFDNTHIDLTDKEAQDLPKNETDWDRATGVPPLTVPAR